MLLIFSRLDFADGNLGASSIVATLFFWIFLGAGTRTETELSILIRLHLCVSCPKWSMVA